MTRRGYLRLLAAALAAAAMLVAVSAGPPVWAQSGNEAVVSRNFPPSMAQSTEAFWTSERMANATPMPMPAPRAVSMQSQPTVTMPQGPALVASSGLPGDARWEESFPQPATLQEPLWGAYPWSYTRYRLFPPRNDLLMYKTFPYRTVGKLFFTIPGQGNYVCSASVVNSENNSVVWTAGHCVYSEGIGFHTNFLFSPGRWIGSNPYGTWTVKTAFTLGGWQAGLLEYDHGALVMNLGGIAPPRKIGDIVGWLGFAANTYRQQHWHLHGYPAGPRDLATTPPGAQFNGENHEICAAAWAADDLPTGGVNDPPTIGVGCDKTGGTSGGPWLIDFSGVGGATNLLNGNNSYRYSGPNPPENLKLYSPYFGNGAVNLRNAAQVVIVP